MKFVGLSASEVADQTRIHGKNLLPEKEPVTALKILLEQFKSPLIYILFLVVFLSLYFREYEDVILVSAVIIIDVVMGFIQEYSAQRTLKKLQHIVKHTTVVIRDSSRQEINTQDLVPGDLLLLGSGDKVPADTVLTEGSLFVSEAILTGEEEPVEKTSQSGSNELYMGTVILSGRCTATVSKIGNQTAIGQIGVSLSEIKERPTPMQQKLAKFSKSLALFVAFVALIIFLIGILTGHPIVDMIKISLVLSVAAIPEGLPIAVTVILSLGMRRILKHSGLVKKLLSIETLGSTSVICTDKTGTLTEGVMKVIKISSSDRKKLLYGLTALNTRRTGIEIAIWDYLKKYSPIDPQKTLDKLSILYEEIFESEKKYALTVVEFNHHRETFILGAPEIILRFCQDKKTDKQAILNEFNSWTQDGLRVVGLLTQKGIHKNKNGFTWLGLIGIDDPIRPEVKEAVTKAKNAGIAVKIVTGDFLNTAVSVAKNIGLQIPRKKIMEGQELEKIPFNKLKTVIPSIDLFCRVSPHQKMKIVSALQENGEVVAMTGDGVNDAPALKKADIGVSVGSATDIAKDASDLILLDNNFKTIVSACEQGRIIYKNIVKVVGYTLSCSLSEIVLIFGTMLLDLPFPLTIIQLLWIHLICDGPPDIALGFEPGDPHIMEEHPQNHKNDRILSWPMLFLIFVISFTTGLLGLAVFAKQISLNHLDLARTIVFAIVGAVDLIYIFSYKNLSQPVYRLCNIFDNKILILSVLYGFLLLAGAIYTRLGQRLLHTVPLDYFSWLIVLFVALISIVWVEIVKKYRRLS